MSVSIRDVAAHAGVSRATVSKVLNESATAQIAASTRERVRLAAKELGYHPSAIARGLTRKQMDTVGIVLPPALSAPTASTFYSSLFNGVLQAAADLGQNVTVFTGEHWVDAKTSLHRFRDGRVDGLLLFYQPPDSDIISTLLDAEVPVVSMDDPHGDERLSYVDVDNIAGSRVVTEHLLDLGHQRIIFLYERHTPLHYEIQREVGYQEAMTARGLTPSHGVVRYNQEMAEAAVKPLFVDCPVNERPTGVICCSDWQAIRVVGILKRHGLRVPEDISITGFNDDGAALLTQTPLTTLRQPYYDLGKAAIELLLMQIADRTKRGERRILPGTLRIDGTTAPSPQN